MALSASFVFASLRVSSSSSLSSAHPSANAFCLAAIAASTAACRAFARRARSRFASVGGTCRSFSSAVAADASVIVASSSFVFSRVFSYAALALVVLRASSSSGFLFRSGRPATCLKSRARR